MRWIPARIIAVGAACTGLLLWGTAAVATSTTLQARSASTVTLTGFGAKLADFAKAHPKNSSTCPGINCYGKNVTTGGVPVPQIVTLLSPSGRVSGYVQDLPDHTSLNSAKNQVLALLPKDTKTVKFTIRHSSIGTCGVWNLKSSSLGSALKANDSAGNIGIELHTILPSGDDGWATGNVNSATVSAFAIPGDFPC